MSLRLSPERYEAVKQEILARDKYMCRHCKMRNGLAVHHIVYRSEQGSDLHSNLCTLCVACHEG